LKDARDKAERIKQAARDGIDLRSQQVLQRARELKFRQAFEDYFRVKRQQLSNAKHLAQWPSTMDAYVFPFFGDVPVSEVTTANVLDALMPIWFSKPETAKRVLQRVEAVFKSAILRGSREKASPCVGVADHLGTRHREQNHHAALPWQEVPEFIVDLRAMSKRGWPTTRLAFEFLILTAARSGEVRNAVWNEFDFDNAVWEIPKERMKSRRAHRVPLSPCCLQILREARALNSDGMLVFEGMKRRQPLSDMTFTKLLRDAGLGDRATAHGFRSAFKNWCSESARARDEVSEAALAHTIKDRVKAAYLRTDFFEERKLLMEAWSAHCQSRSLKLSRNADTQPLSVARV
jgi:integrase